MLKKNFLLLLCLVVSLSSLVATTYYVAKTGDNSNGLSWASAYNEVQSAINAASNGDQVWVAKGKYRPTDYNPKGAGTAVLSRTKTFVIKNGIDLYGGFAGTETALDQRINYWIGQANETILSGDLNNDDDYSQWETYNQSLIKNTENSYNVIYYYNVYSTTIVDGFTISGGNANKKVSGKPYHDGGGAHLTSSYAYLKNCRIIYNQAVNAAGAITFSGGELWDCVISRNRTVAQSTDAGDAGGVKLHNGGKLINSIVTDNYSVENSARGGGVCCSWRSPGHSIINCVIANNKTAGTGGGIGNYGTYSTYTKAYNTIIWGNTRNGVSNQIGGTGTSLSYCAVQGGYSGTGIYNLSSDNDAETGPNFYNSEAGDWRLRITSPLLNIGSNTYTSTPVSVTTDILGNPRIIESIVDMGPYEHFYQVTLQADANGIIYVKSVASGTADGSSWENATSSLQGALDSDAEQVWIAEGTYYPAENLPGMEDDLRAQSFILNSDKQIYGGFPADANTIDNSTLDSRNSDEYLVYLTGDIGQPGLQDDNSYHVLYSQNISSFTILDGLIISGGNANGATPHDQGGAIYLVDSSPTINDVNVEDNQSDSGTDPILLEGESNPIVTDSPGMDDTLPVELTSFSAIITSTNYSRIMWQTASESNLIGYNIYRSELDQINGAIRINPAYIEANNSTTGSEYSYTDQEVELNVTYYYWLQSNEMNGYVEYFGPISLKISEDNPNGGIVEPVLNTSLKNNYPNPFNPETRFEFYVNEGEAATFEIYNLKGQVITSLRNIGSGNHDYVWDGKDREGNQVASGIYFYSLRTKFYNSVKKMVLSK